MQPLRNHRAMYLHHTPPLETIYGRNRVVVVANSASILAARRRLAPVAQTEGLIAGVMMPVTRTASAGNRGTSYSVFDQGDTVMATCSECKGRGYFTCDECNGTGKVDNETCSQCNGSGKFVCDECNGTGQA